MLNTGSDSIASKNGLTLAIKGNGEPTFTLECAVFIGGATENNF